MKVWKVSACIIIVVMMIACAALPALISNNGNNPDQTPAPETPKDPRVMELSDKKFTNADGVPYDVYVSDVSINSDVITLDIPAYWSDGYFSQDAKIYNEHLATLTLTVCVSRAGSELKAVSQGIKDTLTKLNFTGYETNSDFLIPGTEETIGVAMATKKITIDEVDKTIVAVAIRSSNYGGEWGSNVTLGTSGESEGFANGAHRAMEAVEHYLEERSISPEDENTIFWMTGYSRGACVSNLLGKYMIDKYDNDGGRIYCYSFSSPLGGSSSEKIPGCDYSGLFTFMDRNDLVTKVAPQYMGFIRYGTEIYLPESGTGSEWEENMKIVTERFGWEKHSTFSKITVKPSDTLDGTILSLMTSPKKKVTPMEFTDGLLNLFIESGVDRSTYSLDGGVCLEDCLRKIMKSGFALDRLPTNTMEGLNKCLYHIYKEGNGHTGAVDEYIQELVSAYLSMDELKTMFGFTDEEARYFAETVVKLAYYDCKGVDWAGFPHVGTLITMFTGRSSNIIVEYHMPTNYFPWVVAADSYFDDLIAAQV